MNSFRQTFKTQVKSGNNKPELEQVQDLLKSVDLLKSAYFFIDSVSKKDSETVLGIEFQLLLRLTYLSTWLSQIAMLNVGFSNKNKTSFLIPRTLSLTHSNPYGVAVLRFERFLHFYSVNY